VRKTAVPLVLFLTAGVCAVVILLWGRRSTDPIAIDVPITNLQDVVASHDTVHKAAADSYKPKVEGRIEDLSAPAEAILRQLPGIEGLEVFPKSENPSRRLIHLCDFHFVPKDWYAIDTREAKGKSLSDVDVDLLYQEFLLKIELVQLEQMAVLRCLIKHHGLKQVYKEGLTPEQVIGFKDRIAALRDAAPRQAELKQQHKEAQDFVKKLADDGKADTDFYAKGKGIEKELAGMLEKHQLDMLDIGAAGRLMVLRELEVALPLDDEQMLEAAKPAMIDGMITLNAAKVAQREEAMVHLAFAKDKVAVVVLGGEHNLQHAIQQVAGPSCEYVRVTVPAFAMAAGETTKTP
jgi:hypothetical protein